MQSHNSLTIFKNMQQVQSPSNDVCVCILADTSAEQASKSAKNQPTYLLQELKLGIYYFKASYLWDHF